MRMDFKNLGPIKKGSFEPGKLTIITGNNNSGKTYITYTYYYLLKKLLEKNIYDKVLYKINNEVLPFSIEIEELLDFTFNKDDVLKELSNLFVIDGTFFKEFIFNYQFDSSLFRDRINIHYQLDQFKGLKIIRNENSNQINFEIDYSIEIKKKDYKSNNKILKDYKFNNKIEIDYFPPLIIETFLKSYEVLTSERANIVSFYKELDQSRENIINRLKFENEHVLKSELMRLSDYNYFIRKNISIIRSNIFMQITPNHHNNKNYFDDFFYKKIWYPLVGGDYILKDKEIFYTIKKSSKNNLIPFKMTSSSIKSLYLLRLLLEKIRFDYWDIIIIDEPELNLHPYNQLLIARLLVYLVNQGKEVTITTHSEYIIRELNDLIALNNLNKESREKFYEKYSDYSDQILLNHEVVKAYSIRKSILNELNVNEKGIEVDTFNDTVGYLNKKSTILRNLDE